MSVRPLDSFLLAGFAIFLLALSGKAAPNSPIPAAKVDAPVAGAAGKETAVFAGGCFWGTQAVFERLKGVVQTTVGYSGGSANTATYRQVITENDRARGVGGGGLRSRPHHLRPTSAYLLSVAHDPTQLNRQGPDVGTSYRSAIFYANDEQKRIATAYIAQLNAADRFSRGRSLRRSRRSKAFYRAEDYHQDFALKNPDNAYIQICDLPKISALKAQFPELFVDYKGSH